MIHQTQNIELLLIELKKKEFAIQRLINDKKITEHFLDTSINELETLNEELKSYRDKELSQKDLLLKTKETQLTQVVNSMPMAISLVDLDYRYQKFNHLYEEWFSLDTSRLVNKKVYNIVGKKFFYKYSKPHLDKAFTGQNSTVESDIVTIEKKKMYLRMHYIPAYDANGKIIGCYIFSDDITVLKHKEEEINKAKLDLENQNKELEKYISSNMQLENFAHMASHDLKAPLRNIVSFSDLLRNSLYAKVNDHEKECLNIIRHAAIGMQGLIHSLLGYAKVNTEDVNITEIQLQQLLESVLLEIKSDLIESEGSVIWNNLPNIINADRYKMKQLLQNLILNGLKFRKAHIDPIIQITCIDNSHEWIFCVVDNGIGIEKEYLDQIFLIFSRLHASDKYEGSGIGLAIAKTIVEKHQGKISVESEFGEGSKFTFSIRKSYH